MKKRVDFGRRRALTVMTGAAVGMISRPSPAAGIDLVPPEGAWRFLVLRHGNVIGEHRFDFSRRNGDFVVEVAIDIAVDLLGITLFRFTHRAEEVWRDGWLQSLITATDDDGTLWRVKSERSGGVLRGTVNDVAFDVSGFVVPASLWHRDTPKTQVLFGTIDGRTKVVKAENLGEETLSVAGQARQTRHFRLTGEIERDVWYGADCDIAKVTFPARDGSLITLERQ
ncbi:hypothetical protein HBA54_22105 [Pelagibius litoralis]|uniref:Uncharacterized protein n=1 Tax=Pelagibius litoralis TaxID=374515 RepID=A0A967F1K3_9PROT|nr:DUF6134 family protein [Pelagibius litoralis]NIA71297.1 hypothetical protein [Pelagibius litoralis]